MSDETILPETSPTSSTTLPRFAVDFNSLGYERENEIWVLQSKNPLATSVGQIVELYDEDNLTCRATIVRRVVAPTGVICWACRPDDWTQA